MVDFDEAVVADPEVVGDLVQDDAAHLLAKRFRVVFVDRTRSRRRAATALGLMSHF
jgi:hypothetical protein